MNAHETFREKLSLLEKYHDAQRAIASNYEKLLDDLGWYYAEFQTQSGQDVKPEKISLDEMRVTLKMYCAEHLRSTGKPFKLDWEEAITIPDEIKEFDKAIIEDGQANWLADNMKGKK